MTRPLLLVLLLSSSALAEAKRPDLAYHFSVGLGIGAASHSVSAAYLDADPVIVSLVATWSFAAAKEGLDALGFGQPDWLDFAAGVLGGLVGTAVSWLVLMAMGGK